MPNTWYVDLKNGLDTNTGASFAQRIKTLTKASTLAVAGDTVKVMGSTPKTVSTVNATWTKGSSKVVLSSELSKSLYTDGRWTRGSADVSTSLLTSGIVPKQGANACLIETSTSFYTGKIAYWNIGSVTDLSAYQQVSLWFNALRSFNGLQLRLCADSSGSNAIMAIPIPEGIVAPGVDLHCLTLNYGSALPSNVRSLALYATSALPFRNFIVDDIIACKAPGDVDYCLTLNSLISPDGAQWYPIQSIDGTDIYLDGQASTLSQSAPGYQGTTGTFNLRILNPTVVNSLPETFSANGTSGNRILVSGGWDPADMNSRTGYTALDGFSWAGGGLALTGTVGHIDLEYFVIARSAAALGLVADGRGYNIRNSTFAGTGAFSAMPTHAVNIDQVNFLNCSGVDAILNIPETANFNSDGSAWSITNTNCFGATVGGIKVPEFVGSPTPKITGCNSSGNAGFGFDIQSPVDGFAGNVARGNSQGGFRFKNLDSFAAYNLIAQGNLGSQLELSNAFIDIFGLDTNTPGGSGLPQVKFSDDTGGRASIYNWTQYLGTSPAKVLVDLGSAAAGSPIVLPQVNAQKENGSLGANSIYTAQGFVTSSGVTGNGTSIGYRLAPNASASALDPLRFKVATVSCPANASTTIRLFAMANSGVSARFRVEGGKYPGVAAPGEDVTVPVSSSSYSQYQIVVNPSEDVDVDVYFEAWGSATLSAFVSGPLSS